MKGDFPYDPDALPDPYPSGIQGPLGPFRMALIGARVEFLCRRSARLLAEMAEASKDPVVAADQRVVGIIGIADLVNRAHQRSTANEVLREVATPKD